jgi:GDP-4-dehydro-6-deoxy-D-mannose reductase
VNVLITGAAGFIGGFLARRCQDLGCSVLGIDIRAAAPFAGGFEICDVRDDRRLPELLTRFRPERIFHLAAQSYPTVSLVKPRETMDANVGGTVNLFECLRAAGMAPMVVVACSSAEYGFVAAEHLPVRETHPLLPLHPYGVSKVAQDLLAAQYFTNYSIPCVRARIFNTTGPGKIGDVCSDFTRRGVEIDLGIRPPVMLAGNLAKRRALVDARDLVRGLWLAAERCTPGDAYNLGGEAIYPVDEIIEMIRMSIATPFAVKQDPELMRNFDEPVIAGDMTKFRQCTGWSSEIALAQTVRDMLDWWRRRLAPTPDAAEDRQPSLSSK